MKKQWFIILGLLICILMIVGFIGLRIYWSSLGDWYNQVQIELPGVKQKLTVINHDLLSQIPPPEGVTVKEQVDGEGTYYEYGVTTYVRYRIDNPNLDIQAYYQQMMERLGWKLKASDYGGVLDFTVYYNRNACFEVKTYPTVKDTYEISVYQDFQKQEFSPKLPPMWYVKGIREFGKTVVKTCP